MYSLTANRWFFLGRSSGSEISARYSFASFLYGDRVAVFGGIETSACVNDLWSLDIARAGCPAGTEPTGTGCIDCASGHVKVSAGNFACSVCPVGSTCNASAILSCGAGLIWDGMQCTGCSNGTYNPATDSIECLICPDGSVCNATTLVSCEPGLGWDGMLCASCSNGTFKPESGLTECLVCPDGFVCNATAVISCEPGLGWDGTACLVTSSWIPSTTGSMLVTASATRSPRAKAGGSSFGSMEPTTTADNTPTDVSPGSTMDLESADISATVVFGVGASASPTNTVHPPNLITLGGLAMPVNAFFAIVGLVGAIFLTAAVGFAIVYYKLRPMKRRLYNPAVLRPSSMTTNVQSMVTSPQSILTSTSPQSMLTNLQSINTNPQSMMFTTNLQSINTDPLMFTNRQSMSLPRQSMSSTRQSVNMDPLMFTTRQSLLTSPESVNTQSVMFTTRQSVDTDNQSVDRDRLSVITNPLFNRSSLSRGQKNTFSPGETSQFGGGATKSSESSTYYQTTNLRFFP